jgi:YD repeat-containing protein
MKKVFFLLFSALIVISCDNPNVLDLNGNPIQIEEFFYDAVEKNGVISKGQLNRILPRPNAPCLLDDIKYQYKLDLVTYTPIQGLSIKMSKNGVEKIILNGGLEENYTFKYNDNKLVEVIQTDRDSNSYTYRYLYDDQGRRIEIIKSRGNIFGSIIGKTTYQYSKKTNKITSETEFSNFHGKLDTIQNSHFSSDKNYHIEKFRYYPEVFFGTSNDVNVIKSKTNDSGDVIEVEEEQETSKKLLYKKFMAYDRHNNMIRLEYNSDNEKKIYENKYKYDKYNNWIEQIVFENKKPICIVERKIKY